MMRRFKLWLINKFLPAWCRQELLEENSKLQKKCDSQRHTIDNLRAYISGMERVLRSRTGVYIKQDSAGGGV